MRKIDQALHDAVKNKDFAATKAALMGGANPNARDKEWVHETGIDADDFVPAVGYPTDSYLIPSETALMRAAAQSAFKIVRLLLQYGADPDLIYKGETARHEAWFWGAKKTMDFLDNFTKKEYGTAIGIRPGHPIRLRAFHLTIDQNEDNELTLTIAKNRKWQMLKYRAGSGRMEFTFHGNKYFVEVFSPEKSRKGFKVLVLTGAQAKKSANKAISLR